MSMSQSSNHSEVDNFNLNLDSEWHELKSNLRTQSSTQWSVSEWKQNRRIEFILCFAYINFTLKDLLDGWSMKELLRNWKLCILIVTAKRSNENSFNEIISDGDSTQNTQRDNILIRILSMFNGVKTLKWIQCTELTSIIPFHSVFIWCASHLWGCVVYFGLREG